METTCQICGRNIKAKIGLIAHHGYTRPGGGWQTASCHGARELPYEQSCDVLPRVIALVHGHIAAVTAKKKNFLKNPPEELTWKGYWDKEPVTKKRPDDFNPNNSWSRQMGTYENEYKHLISQMESEIKFAKMDLDFMQARLKNWKPLPLKCTRCKKEIVGTKFVPSTKMKGRWPLCKKCWEQLYFDTFGHYPETNFNIQK